MGRHNSLNSPKSGRTPRRLAFYKITNMKIFIAISCLLAAASAGLLGHSTYTFPSLHYAEHIPVIGSNGVPLDEPAVAEAKAQHFAAHLEAKARNGDVAIVAPYEHVAAAVPVAYAAHYSGHYAGPQHLPVIGPNGVPLDEPAVAAARAHHAAAHIEAQARNGEFAHYVAPIAEYTHVAAPVATIAHAVPLDTPEVAAAKAAHFAAHAEVKARNGGYHYAPLVHYRKRRGILHGYAAAPIAHHYAGPQHLPVIGPNGVPLDEPAVVAARAHHAAAHVEVAARNGDLHFAHVATAPIAHYSAAPVATVAHYAPAYAGPQYIPVIGPNGVPLDEPAVAAARAHHAAAHLEAKVRNGDAALVASAPIAHVATGIAPVAYAGHFGYAGHQHIPVIGPNGVPLDEPAVAAAKAHHAAAHIEAKARNGDLYVAAPLVHSW